MWLSDEAEMTTNIDVFEVQNGGVKRTARFATNLTERIGNVVP
jgi:hypothetical protein